MSEKPTDVSAVRGLTDAQLGERYISLKKNQESSIKDQESREEEQVKQSARADLAGLKDLIEEEMVSRLDTKALLSTYLARDGKNIPPEQIDTGIRKLFANKFGLQLSNEDLQSLRDDLPIIDEVRNGKYIAYGKKDEHGNEIAHAVAVDSVSIQRDAESGKYTFQYGINVQVLNGDLAFSQLVDDTSISLGQSALADHRFEVELTADTAKKKPSVVVKVAADKDAKLLEGHLGVTIRPRKNGEPFSILIDKKLYEEAKLNPGKNDDLRQAVAHEIGHVAGFVEDWGYHHGDEKVGAAGLDKKSAEALKVSDNQTKRKVKDAKDRQEKEFLGLTKEQVEANFDLKESQNRIQATFEQKGFSLSQQDLAIITNAIKNYTGDKFPAFVESRGLGATDFVAVPLLHSDGPTKEAVKCKEDFSNDVKNILNNRFVVLIDHVKAELEKTSFKSDFQQANGKYDYSKVIALSQHLKNLTSSSQSIKNYLESSNFQGDINTIKNEITLSLQTIDNQKKASKEAAAKKDTQTAAAKNGFDGLDVSKTNISFDQLDKDILDLVNTQCKPSLLQVPLKNGIKTDELKINVSTELIKAITTNINYEGDQAQQKKEYVAKLYYDSLVKSQKIVIPEPKKMDDSYELKNVKEDALEVVFFNKAERESVEQQRAEKEKKENEAKAEDGTSTNILSGPLKSLRESLSKMGPLGAFLAPLVGGIFLFFQRFTDTEYMSTWVQSAFSKGSKTKLEAMESEYNYRDTLSTSLTTLAEQKKEQEPFKTLIEKKVIPGTLSRKFAGNVLAMEIQVDNEAYEVAKKEDPNTTVPQKIAMPAEGIMDLLFSENTSKRWVEAANDGSLTEKNFEDFSLNILLPSAKKKSPDADKKTEIKSAAPEVSKILATLKPGEGLPVGATILAAAAVKEGISVLQFKQNERIFKLSQNNNPKEGGQPLNIVEISSKRNEPFSETSSEDNPAGLKKDYATIDEFKANFETDIQQPVAKLEVLRSQLTDYSTWFFLNGQQIAYLKDDKDIDKANCYAKIISPGKDPAYHKLDKEKNTWNLIEANDLPKFQSKVAEVKYTEFNKQGTKGVWQDAKLTDYPNCFYGVTDPGDGSLYWRNDRKEFFVTSAQESWIWRTATQQETQSAQKIKNAPAE